VRGQYPCEGPPRSSRASTKILLRYLDRTGVQTIVQSLHAQSLKIVLHGRADSWSSRLAYSRSQRSSLPMEFPVPLTCADTPFRRSSHGGHKRLRRARQGKGPNLVSAKAVFAHDLPLTRVAGAWLHQDLIGDRHLCRYRARKLHARLRGFRREICPLS
jgi:hypothetical protein